MDAATPQFSLEVEAVKGFCPAGDNYATEQIGRKALPLLSCEGPCIRGEIARLAANLVAEEAPAVARACAPETFYVPHSAMAHWVRQAEKVIMVDGCFLKCHGRVLSGIVGQEKIVHFDAYPMYRKYTDLFRIEDVPEAERKAVAREVADKILARLKQDLLLEAAAA